MSKKSGGTESTSTVSGAQQETQRAIADFLNPRIGQGATPLPFDAAVEIPSEFEDAFNQFVGDIGGDRELVESAFTRAASGIPGFTADVPGVVRDFEKNIISPITRQLNETLGLDTRNALNQPGRFFASDVREKTGSAIANQLGITTAPLLSQQIEGERNRGFQSQQLADQLRLPGAQGLQNLPFQQFQQIAGATQGFVGLQQQQQNLQAADFLRLTQEADPFLAAALGSQFSTQTTTENIVQPSSGFSFGGAAAGAAGGFLVAGLPGAVIGGAVGGVGI